MGKSPLDPQGPKISKILKFHTTWHETPLDFKKLKSDIFDRKVAKSGHFCARNNNECYWADHFCRKFQFLNFLTRFFTFWSKIVTTMRVLIKEFHKIFRSNPFFRIFRFEKCLQTPLSGFSDLEKSFSIGRPDRQMVDSGGPKCPISVRNGPQRSCFAHTRKVLSNPILKVGHFGQLVCGRGQNSEIECARGQTIGSIWCFVREIGRSGALKWPFWRFHMQKGPLDPQG